MQDTNFELDSMNLAEPYNMEAEQSVLGAALLDSERVMPALINTLKPEMFYSRQNAEIFSQMVDPDRRGGFHRRVRERGGRQGLHCPPG